MDIAKGTIKTLKMTCQFWVAGSDNKRVTTGREPQVLEKMLPAGRVRKGREEFGPVLIQEGCFVCLFLVFTRD